MQIGKAGDKEVRHRLLIARLGFKPDVQSTADYHFFRAMVTKCSEAGGILQNEPFRTYWQNCQL
jgi:hypothetical protein